MATISPDCLANTPYKGVWKCSPGLHELGLLQWTTFIWEPGATYPGCDRSRTLKDHYNAACDSLRSSKTWKVTPESFEYATCDIATQVCGHYGPCPPPSAADPSLVKDDYAINYNIGKSLFPLEACVGTDVGTHGGSS